MSQGGREFPLGQEYYEFETDIGYACRGCFVLGDYMVQAIDK